MIISTISKFIKVNKESTDKFQKWLEQNGAEILPAKSVYEEIRFKGSEVGVKYKSGKFSGPYAKNAYLCYLHGRKWDGRPASYGRNGTYKYEKIVILKRDGHDCFYCGRDLGEDITLEHLIALVSGGANELSNMVLAHEKCNQIMSHKPIVEKVAYAIKTRMENKRITENTLRQMNKNVTDVCKIGQGAACCKYLLAGAEGFECAKVEPGWKNVVDKAWNETKSAQGDNCDGLSKEDLK
jgi:5-methylcytosine-specific restriction endonuclease McrA